MNSIIERTATATLAETFSIRDMFPRIKQRFQNRMRSAYPEQLNKKLTLPIRVETQSERPAVVYEPYDISSQSYYGASMQRNDSAETIPGDIPHKRTSSAALHHDHRVDNEGRKVFQELRAPAVIFASIEQSLFGMLKEFSLVGTHCEIIVMGKPKSLRPTILEQITLIGREALVNALLHSEATRIEAEIEYSSHGLRLVVRDNGCGMDRQLVRAKKGSSPGLREMRDRARQIDAQLKIWSRSGAGTEVEISLPSYVIAGAQA